MSAAFRFPHDLGAAGLRMTAREYFSIGQTDERYELIDGVLVMSPSPTISHQNIIRALLRQIEPLADALPGVRVVLNTDVRFAEDSVYRPDMSIYLPGRVDPHAEYPDLPPDLIIEVASPSTQARDLVTKRDDYARFGVREYWALDSATLAVRVFRMSRGTKKYSRPSSVKSVVEAVAVPGIRIDLALLRATVSRMASGGAMPTKRRR